MSRVFAMQLEPTYNGTLLTKYRVSKSFIFNHIHYGYAWLGENNCSEMEEYYYCYRY